MLVHSAWLVALASLLPLQSKPEPPWWPSAVDQSLDREPSVKDHWVAELMRCAEPNRAGLAYLVTHLPQTDLKALPPSALTTAVAQANDARARVAWGGQLPDDIYLDAVLPPFSMTEPRQSMRGEFQARYLPLVRDCTTPGQAALRLNASLFRDYAVTYNTRRLRTDQCSRESIAQGMATCTGLSIMLVEACRAVGVPARVAGIASWPGRGGNHTWVEIWDLDGSWHHLGAAEPDPRGLDHAWFSEEAGRTPSSPPRNAIHASAYRPTGTLFPLVWSPRAQVPAVNVSALYAPRSGQPTQPVSPRLMVEVRRNGERVPAEVAILDAATAQTRLIGTSFGPETDINRHLETNVEAGSRWLVTARVPGAGTWCFANAGEGDTVLRLDLDAQPTQTDRDTLAALLAQRFAPDVETPLRNRNRELLGAIPFDESMRSIAWTAFRESARHASLRQQFDDRVVATDDRKSPYLWRHVGDRPENGWALVIALHGGGGAPSRVNDSQWNSMFERYYKEHPEAGGYVYLALRAPNDEWNGFYDDSIAPLIERLILQFVLFGDVDPNRVSLLGASHGGYGAFVIGTKIPDRFAAVHASAAAPTDGETRGENLRNLPFTFMVGENDTAHGRAERCQAFARNIDDWKLDYGGGYPGGFEWKPDIGHSVPDRDHVANLLHFTRDPHPDRVVWSTSDDQLACSYWVIVAPAAEGRFVDVSLDTSQNQITINDAQLANSLMLLCPDPRRLDLTRPLLIQGQLLPDLSVSLKPDLGSFCNQLDVRADPELASPIQIAYPAP